MERIGIAASKISRGNLIVYNLCVIFIATLFSTFIFVVSMGPILLALTLIGLLVKLFFPSHLVGWWIIALRICFITLTTLVGLFNLCAILKNIKLNKGKI